MRASRLAPAKVNLFLHVGPLQPDGYHPLASLMVFADIGDRLDLLPADAMGLEVEGPFAADLQGTPAEENLIWRAVRLLLERSGARPQPFRLRLDKRLPVASGLGGGSSDAGAALRLVRDAFSPDFPDAALEAVAAAIGSDGPACLHARATVATGRGERLAPAPALPPLPAVLVNPGVPCSTGRVYRAFDDAGVGAADLPDLPDLPPRLGSVEAAIAWLGGLRNDLENPALTVAPEIAEVLRRLRTAPEVALARVSGSGATCFALCPSADDAQRLAAALSAERPGWWVRACTFRDAPADDHEPVNARNPLRPVA